MRKLLQFLFLTGGVLGVTNVHAQWTPTEFEENAWLLCQSNNGNLLAANHLYPDLGTIFISKDEGNTWDEVSVAPYEYTAYLVKDESIYMGGTNSTVAISHDNGENWHTSSFWYLFPEADPSEPIYAIESHNNRIYVSLLAYGVVYSEDQGETWQLTDVDSLLDPDNSDNGGQWSYDLQSYNGKLYTIGAYGIWEYNEEQNKWTQVNDDWYSYKTIVVEDTLYVVYNAPGLPYAIRYTTDLQNWDIMPTPTDASTSVGFIQEYQGAFFMGHVEQAVYYTLDQGINWIPYRDDFPAFSPIPGFSLYGVPMSLVFLEDSILAAVYSGLEDVGGIYRAPIPSFLNTQEINLVANAAVYPNPAIDWITLKIDNVHNSPTQLAVFDSLGRKVMDLNYESKNVQNINISTLSTGIYFLRIQNNDGIQNIKFIKK